MHGGARPLYQVLQAVLLAAAGILLGSSHTVKGHTSYHKAHSATPQKEQSSKQ